MKTKTAMTILVIVLLAAGLRLAFMGVTPWDWDEPVYTRIANNVQSMGHPSLDIGGEEEWYTYHPPFHFWLLSGWYALIGDDTIWAGRLFSSLAATICVVLLMVLVWEISQDKQLTLFAGFLFATDGWFGYTSLLVKLDTTAVAIGIAGLILFVQALKTPKTGLFIATGLVIGIATIYKHVAAVFLLTIAIHWLITKGNRRQHLIVLAAAGFVIVLYILGMAIFVGEPFTHATVVQVRRTLGQQEARGLQYGLVETLQAMFNTYWAFSGTVLVLFIGGIISIWMGRLHWQGEEHWLAVITAWALAALLMLGGIKLRNPHYLVYAIPPATVLVAEFLLGLIEQRRNKLAGRLLAVLLVMSFSTFSIRATRFSPTNALGELQYQMDQLPADVTVLSEESICALIDQPCYPFGHYQTAGQIASIPGGKPQYVVVYTTTTQKPPQTEAVLELISEGQVIYSISGWKETLTIIQVESP